MTLPPLQVSLINWTQNGGSRSDQLKYSRFADLAYKEPNDRAAILKQFDKAERWTYDTELSNDDVAVFVNKKTREPVVAVRGTDLGSRSRRWRDLAEDVGIFLGISRHGNRTRSVNSLVGHVKKKYVRSPTMTGHSLGGKVASNIAKKHKLKAAVFNQGSSPIDAIAGIAVRLGRVVSAHKPKANDITHYTTNKGSTIDPISISAKADADSKQELVEKKPDVGAHGLDNFTDNNVQLGDGRRSKKKQSKWMAHVKKYQRAHGCSYKVAMKKASSTYKR